MLAFEDLHWADPTSLDLLRTFADRGAQDHQGERQRSRLLRQNVRATGEIIADLKAAARIILKRIAELPKQVQAGKTDDTPKKLDTPGKAGALQGSSLFQVGELARTSPAMR